ncbi:MAG: cbb3-type cytochrome c oxidase N-terminal domain-containing protein [Phycisphaerales bacterium]
MAEIAHNAGARAGAHEAQILEHDADGIREYDNPMPFWWSAIFWGTIFFSGLYILYYMVGIGPSVRQDYDDEVAGFFQEQAAKLGDLKPTPMTIKSLMDDPKMMKAAAGLFASNCVVCHTKDGGGGTGPNLCDDSYLNVKKVEDIFTVISNGVVPKGMPAWDKRFGEAQRVLLTAYVAGLRGTHPATPKDPQGDPIPAWSFPAAGTAPAAGASNAGAAAGGPKAPAK